MGPGPRAALAMLGMFWIRENVEEVLVSVRTTAVFRRSGARAVDAEWIFHSIFMLPYGDHLDVVMPIVAEIVEVRQLRARLQVEIHEQDLRGIFAGGFFVLGRFEATRSELKLVEVIVLPAIRFLDRAVQAVKRGAPVDEQLAPDQRIDVTQRDFQFEDGRYSKGAAFRSRGFCADHDMILVGLRSCDQREFGRGLFLIRREHHAEGGEDDIERAVGERKIFSVRFAKRDREIFRERATARGLEEIGDVVGGRDFAPAARGGERSVAIAGGDIEDARAGADVERFAEIFADGLEGGADDGVVASGPGELLAGFDGAVVEVCGRHNVSLSRVDSRMRTRAS